MSDYIPVGMGELKIARHPASLVVYGIGSCVIIAMYDKKNKIGGFSHVMLPDSSGIDKDKLNPAKFADTAVPLLFKKMGEEGALKSKLVAKLVGGAEMFPPTEDFSSNIGRDNVEAVKKALSALQIPIEAEDTGGTRGRSVEFDLDSGLVKLSILGQETKEL
ncbi:MAG: chemotaxis protein CheD [Candidatus Rifleibacteriota bacterium]